MRRFKIILLVLIGGIVGGILFTFWSNRQEVPKKEESPLPLLEDRAEKHLEKIRLVEDKQGRRTWELEAKSIQQYQDLLVLEELTVTFFTKGGQSFTLSGKQGRIDQDKKDMKLLGDVRLISDDGYQFRTHSVDYHHADRKVTTADPVEIEGKDIRLRGKGLHVDLEAQTFKILHEVKTRWTGRQG